MLKTRIKIVFLIGQLGLGGSERQLYLLLKHLDKDLLECHVVVFNPSPYVVLNESLERIGVKVWPVPLNCTGVWRRVRFVYRIFQSISPDIVHSWTVHDNPYAGLAGFLTGIPVRFGSLRGSTNLPGFQKLPSFYRWLSLYSVSMLAVNSEAISKELCGKRYPPGRIFVLPNCIENSSSEQDAPDLSSLGIQERHRVVGLVGNLRCIKNHLMFVEGLARVLPQFPDVRGLIVGQPIQDEPDLPDKIASRIKELNLNGNVIMAGFRSDVPALMRRLTVFCLTSTHEGMPNVILEAMAAARPVVATKVGGVPELVKDGVNGFLVESGDIEGFARAVKSLLADPALAQRMGFAGRQRVEQEFSPQQAVERLTKLYLNSLAEKGITVNKG